MQKWDYLALATFRRKWKTVDGQELDKDTQKLPVKEMLKKLGEEEWELVSVARKGGSEHFYFKRPTP
jgi:hypothetical protein